MASDPEHVTRLYIAGPMTGLPLFNYPAFIHAEHDLGRVGYEVENPTKNGGPKDHPDWAWEDWVRASLRQLLECHAVATLPGWFDSRGARLEVHVAQSLGMPVRVVSEWLDRAA